jgi:F-type H+-transporting ATPase subunit a
MNISLAPDILFNLGSFPVTNSFLWGLILTITLIVFFGLVSRKLKKIPGPVQNFVEMIFETGYDFVRTVTGSDKKTEKVFPLVFTLFLFIIIANLLVYIPGQSAITIARGDDVIPVFRAVVADYGMVFAMTMVSVIVTQLVAIYAVGPFGYVGKFLNFKGLADFFKGVIKGKFNFGLLAQGLFDVFMGVMDLVGEIAKVISLSFRLFGNIFAGEVLTAVMLFLSPFLIPLPFMLLGLLSAIVQAFVFAVLTLIYITMASEVEGEELKEEIPARSCDV